jgi:hypothetical protein
LVLKPVLGNVPNAAPRPKPESTPARQRWSFSFRFWRQHENFGVGACDARWFVSLFERLQELSKQTVSDVMDDLNVKDGLRIHNIDWASNNIPISRTDIDWVDEVYWNNPEEYPLFQFHISKALGRVAGFLDENRVFNIVLLDRRHNLQPSKRNGYRIQTTTTGECELTALVVRLENVVRRHAELSDNGRVQILNVMRELHQSDGRTILLLPVDQKVIGAIDALIALGQHSDPGEYLITVVDEAFARL